VAMANEVEVVTRHRRRREAPERDGEVALGPFPLVHDATVRRTAPRDANEMGAARLGSTPSQGEDRERTRPGEQERAPAKRARDDIGAPRPSPRPPGLPVYP